MKYLSILILLLGWNLLLFAQEEKDIDYSHLCQTWSVKKVLINGEVMQSDIEDGTYTFTFKKDKITCYMHGEEDNGTWKVFPDKHEVILYYPLKETPLHIQKLTKNELIFELTDSFGEETVQCYLKATEEI